jgi:hypothetical protein
MERTHSVDRMDAISTTHLLGNSPSRFTIIFHERNDPFGDSDVIE